MEPAVPGMRCHVKNSPFGGWIYEEVSLQNVKNTTTLLARIMIAKVEDQNRLLSIFRETPVIQDDPEWRCRTWIADVLQRISRDGHAVGTSELDWVKIETFARNYVARKANEGRYMHGADMAKDKPMWNLIEGKEAIP